MRQLVTYIKHCKQLNVYVIYQTFSQTLSGSSEDLHLNLNILTTLIRQK